MNSRQFQELQEAYMNVYQEIDEANRAEKELGLTSRERTRARNLHQNTDTPIFYKKKNNALKDRSSSTTNTAHRNMAAKRRENASEQVDLYDVILSHLIDEGYASTEEAATAIMVNMSEEWRDSVVEAYKDLPVGKMIRKAGVKQFKHGMSVGSGASSNPKTPQQVGKMSAIASMHDPERAKAQSKLKKD
jgi:hypothetical protein